MKVVIFRLHFEPPTTCQSEETIQVNSQETPPSKSELSHADGPSVDITEAVTRVIEKQKLFPDVAFTASVLEVAQIVPNYRMVVVVGPAGCGKSERINIYLQALKELGIQVKVQRVFTRALESQHLLGFSNPQTGWTDGLLPRLLRHHSLESLTTSEGPSELMTALHFDGEIDMQHMENIQALLCGSDLFILSSNERIKLPDSIKLFWELESLENISPALACCLGLLVVTDAQEMWRLILNKWYNAWPQTSQQVLRQLTEEFLGPALQWVCESSPLRSPEHKKTDLRMKKVVNNTSENMVQTFCRIFEASSLFYFDNPVVYFIVLIIL
ncbi:dynein axonemal heavy chain 9-like [Erpetoichthys calabaricus]|uniref:dynein axonemal heavy chain 9-like n=1 Tax=Erpetoichthys calabaricus TaxID=27687 RepID=UPI0022344A4B|nr:dynein axonemal heavy chain 9-like [Erpetoichthys calabaricus]